MKNILLVLTMIFSALANGTTIDLIAKAFEALDGEPTLALEFANVIATVTATDGVTNRTLSGFVANAPGGADDADAIDGKAGSESISVQCSEQVRLVAIALSGFGRCQVAEFSLDDLVLPAPDSGLVTSPLTSANTRTLALRYVNGSGFCLDGIVFAPLAPEFRYNARELVPRHRTVARKRDNEDNTWLSTFIVLSAQHVISIRAACNSPHRLVA